MKIGTIVRLQSGGPPMVVEKIVKDTALCVWFSGMKLQQDTFPISTLEIIEVEGIWKKRDK